MNRRSVLGFLFAAPMVGPTLVKEALAPAPVTGFGLAVEKIEGESLAYDGAITRTARVSALWPGIREWYARHYSIDEIAAAERERAVAETEDRA